MDLVYEMEMVLDHIQVLLIHDFSLSVIFFIRDNVIDAEKVFKASSCEQIV